MTISPKMSKTHQKCGKNFGMEPKVTILLCIQFVAVAFRSEEEVR